MTVVSQHDGSMASRVHVREAAVKQGLYSVLCEGVKPLPEIKGVDMGKYRDTLLALFSNVEVMDCINRVTTNSASKSV